MQTDGTKNVGSNSRKKKISSFFFFFSNLFLKKNRQFLSAPCVFWWLYRVHEKKLYKACRKRHRQPKLVIALRLQYSLSPCVFGWTVSVSTMCFCNNRLQFLLLTLMLTVFVWLAPVANGAPYISCAGQTSALCASGG